jgi:hypothetical protein
VYPSARAVDHLDSRRTLASSSSALRLTLQLRYDNWRVGSLRNGTRRVNVVW